MRVMRTLVSKNSIHSSQTAILLFVVGVSIAFSYSIDDAYASHLSEDTKWQLVYLSSNPACSNYDYQMVWAYDEVADKYLELYQFANTKYDPLCMPNSEFREEYEPPEDLDLLIMVFDRTLGENSLHMQRMGGLYTHYGPLDEKNHVIFFCDCSNFEYSDPMWILTHELSHFVLHYLNYDQDIVEKLVHGYDKKYDECRENYDAACADVVEKLRIESKAYSYNVIPPYEDAIGASMQQSPVGEIPENLVKLNKVIAKWWAEGKITEGDYSNVLGFLTSEEEYLADDGSEQIMFADDPIDEVETWQDVLGETEESSVEELMEMVPYEFYSEDDQVFRGQDISGLPDWFKQTTEWWIDGKIPNEDFIRSVDYLRDAGVIRPQ